MIIGFCANGLLGGALLGASLVVAMRIEGAEPV